MTGPRDCLIEEENPILEAAPPQAAPAMAASRSRLAPLAAAAALLLAAGLAAAAFCAGRLPGAAQGAGRGEVGLSQLTKKLTKVDHVADPYGMCKAHPGECAGAAGKEFLKAADMTVAMIRHLKEPNYEGRSGMWCVGLNVLGLEQNVAGGRDAGAYTLPSKDDIARFRERGANCFRLPVAWERLVTTSGDLSAAKWDPVPGLQALIDHVTTELDNYLIITPYNAEKGLQFQNQDVTETDFAQLWTAICEPFKTNGKVIFGLYGAPQGGNAEGTDLFFSAASFDQDGHMVEEWRSWAQAAIDAIRHSGADNLILVPGLQGSAMNSWTGARWWGEKLLDEDDAGNTRLAALTDPAKNLAYDVHTYMSDTFDANAVGCEGHDTSHFCEGGADCRGNDYGLELLIEWATKYGKKVMVTEMTSVAKPGTENQCKVKMEAHIQRMRDSGVFLGFQIKEPASDSSSGRSSTLPWFKLATYGGQCQDPPCLGPDSRAIRWKEYPHLCFDVDDGPRDGAVLHLEECCQGKSSQQWVLPVAPPRRYTPVLGKSCGGTSIVQWANGGDASNGRTDLSIAECQATCDSHKDCAGFEVRGAGCYWKGWDLRVTAQTGVDCYKADPAPARTGNLRWMADPSYCLKIKDGSNAPGTGVRLARCEYDQSSQPTGPQKFQIPYFTEDTGMVRWTQDNSKCFDAGGWFQDDAALSIIIWDCDSNNHNQQFIFPQVYYNPTPAEPALFSLRLEQNPNFCLDVSEGRTDSGTKVQVWSCVSGHPNQIWKLPTYNTLARTDTYTRIGFVRWAAHPEFCLLVSEAVNANERKLVIWRCDDTNIPQDYKNFVVPVDKTASAVISWGGKAVVGWGNKDACIKPTNTFDGASVWISDCSQKFFFTQAPGPSPNPSPSPSPSPSPAPPPVVFDEDDVPLDALIGPLVWAYPEGGFSCVDVFFGNKVEGNSIVTWYCDPDHPGQNQIFIMGQPGTFGNIRWGMDPDYCLKVSDGRDTVVLGRCEYGTFGGSYGPSPKTRFQLPAVGDRLIKWAPYNWSPNKCFDVGPGDVNWGDNLELVECHQLYDRDSFRQRFTLPQPQIRTSVQWIFHPERCIDVSNSRAADGTRIQLWTCGNKPHNAQEFMFPALGETGPIRLWSNPKYCLDIMEGNGENGNLLHLWHCEFTNANQQFMTPEGGRGLIRWAANPDKCLDVAYGENRDGTNIQVWDCNRDSRNQNFKLDASSPVPDPKTGAIRWTQHNLCVDVIGEELHCGRPIQLQVCSASDTRQQFFLPLPGSSGKIRMKELDYCLQVQDASKQGSEVVLEPCASQDPSLLFTVPVDRGTIVLTGTNNCLDVRDGGNADKTWAVLQLWPCNTNSDNQKFLVPARLPTEAVGQVRWPFRTNMCLDTKDPTLVNGVRMQVKTCDGNNFRQQWVVPALGETGAIKMKDTDWCLHAPSSPWPHLELWRCGDARGPLFQFTMPNKEEGLIHYGDVCVDVDPGDSDLMLNKCDESLITEHFLVPQAAKGHPLEV